MHNSKNQLSIYFENASLLLLGLLLLFFPLAFTILTTDPFSLPKQILLGVSVFAALLLLALKMVAEKTIRLRRTPFDLPLLVLIVVTLISSLVSVNRYDSLMSFVPFLFSILSFFVIVQFAKKESSIVFLLSTLFTGAALASLPSLFVILPTLLHQQPIYILPFSYAHIPTFSVFGNLLDQSMYLAAVGIVSITVVFPNLKRGKKIAGIDVAFIICAIVIFLGLFATVYQLYTSQKPALLPFEVGLQTGFAAISQDAGRTLKAFLFGSGFGTYMIDFTRFKQASFNLNQTLWSLTFFRSSNFFLELLATTGVLGILSFIWLTILFIKSAKVEKTFKNPLYIALLLTFVLAALLPISPTIQTLIFVLLGLFAATQALYDSKKYFDVELYSVAFKKGLIALHPHETEAPNFALAQEHSFARLLPVSFLIIVLLITGVIGYYTTLYVVSDVTFQKALVAAAANKGLDTYNNELAAINVFPYRDGYHRIYSQTNLALANSLANSAPKTASPSSQVQQTMLQLIQQSINSARLATTLSPLNTLNWQNLSSVYRSLIGFGQNAANFAILADQQAIALDPNNPQEYLNLGGIYYQQGLWNDAQRQFQIAVNLKPDFANAYYNLGHALEQQGDLQNALTQYETVRSLIAKDPTNVKKIETEIASIQEKIGTQKVAGAKTKVQEVSPNQLPLQISSPSAQLPKQQPPVKIPPPPQASESGR